MGVGQMRVFRHMLQTYLHAGAAARSKGAARGGIEHIDRRALDGHKALVLRVLQVRDAGDEPLGVFM